MVAKKRAMTTILAGCLLMLMSNGLVHAYSHDSVKRYVGNNEGMTCSGLQCWYGNPSSKYLPDALDECTGVEDVQMDVNIKASGYAEDSYHCTFVERERGRWRGGFRRSYDYKNHYRCYYSNLTFTFHNKGCRAIAEIVDNGDKLIRRWQDVQTKVMDRGDDAIIKLKVPMGRVDRIVSNPGGNKIAVLAGPRMGNGDWIGDASKPVFSILYKDYKFYKDVRVDSCTDKIDKSNRYCYYTRHEYNICNSSIYSSCGGGGGGNGW